MYAPRNFLKLWRSVISQQETSRSSGAETPFRPRAINIWSLCGQQRPTPLTLTLSQKGEGIRTNKAQLVIWITIPIFARFSLLSYIRQLLNAERKALTHANRSYHRRVRRRHWSRNHGSHASYFERSGRETGD